MMSDCVFDKEDKREEMNGFRLVRPKHNGGEDGGAGNIEHQWRCRLLGKNDICNEKVPRQALLTHSFGYRCT